MKTKALRNEDRLALMSEYGELPEYNVDEYADRLTVARRKFDRLCRFSLDEHEESFDDEATIDWEVEKKRRGQVLNQWQRETFGVMAELLRLIHQVRCDQTVLDVFLLERSTDKVAHRRSKKR
jgi:hypothetical protein